MAWSCSAVSTGIEVWRARISGSRLSRLGARWVTTMNAIPGAAGMALNRCSSASTPPAEAPTPTIGKGASITAGQVPTFGKEASLAGAAVSLGLPQCRSKHFCRPSGARTQQELGGMLDCLLRGPDFLPQLGNLAASALDQVSRAGQQLAVF